MQALQPSSNFYPIDHQTRENLERQDEQYSLISKIALGVFVGMVCIPLNITINFVVTVILNSFGIEVTEQQECMKIFDECGETTSVAANSYTPMQKFLLLYGCLLGPIFEEIGFRGCLDSFLQSCQINPSDANAKTARIIATSLLFGAAHLSEEQGYANIPIFAVTTFLGGVFHLLKEETGDIIAPCAAHATHNTIALLPQILGE